MESKINVNNSRFINNSAEFEGGAIFDIYAPMIIENSSFISNNAINGGGIFVDNATTIKIISNSFVLNNAGRTVSRVLSRAVIYLVLPLPEGSSGLPEDVTGSHLVFCSVLLRMGFARHPALPPDR